MASGASLTPFNGYVFAVPSANYPLVGAFGGFNIPVCRFTNSGVLTAYFPLIMPQFYTGGGVTVFLNWLAETATSGNVGWTIAFSRLNPNNQNFGTPAFGPSQSVAGVAVAGVAGVSKQSSKAVTAGTNMNGIVAGDQFVMSLSRDNTVGSNAAGFADMMTGEIRET
jgi:hypothetical protein